MGTETVAVYTKEYSELCGLQKAASVHYRLLRADGALTLELSATPAQKSSRCPLWGVSEKLARELLRFVYENSVAPDQLCDVIEDVCGIALHKL